MIRVARPALAVLLLAAATAGAAAPARADQTDRRLDGLFVQLHAAESVDAAQPVEAQIWAIWLRSGRADTDRLMTVGVLALDTGDLDTALVVFGRVVALDPAFAEGWNKRATVLFLLGRYRESAQDIARVLALEPRHFGALSGLALCDEDLGQDGAALRALEQVAKLYPSMAGLADRIAALRQKVQGEPI